MTRSGSRALLFDHFVGPQQKGRWYRKAERLSCLDVKGHQHADVTARSTSNRRLDGLTNLMSEVGPEVHCQSAFKFDPVSASNFDPFGRRVLTVALVTSELAGIAETRRARVV